MTCIHLISLSHYLEVVSEIITNSLLLQTTQLWPVWAFLWHLPLERGLARRHMLSSVKVILSLKFAIWNVYLQCLWVPFFTSLPVFMIWYSSVCKFCEYKYNFVILLCISLIISEVGQLFVYLLILHFPLCDLLTHSLWPFFHWISHLFLFGLREFLAY